MTRVTTSICSCVVSAGFRASLALTARTVRLANQARTRLSSRPVQPDPRETPERSVQVVQWEPPEQWERLALLDRPVPSALLATLVLPDRRAIKAIRGVKVNKATRVMLVTQDQLELLVNLARKESRESKENRESKARLVPHALMDRKLRRLMCMHAIRKEH
jgi:hypothetical protein